MIRKPLNTWLILGDIQHRFDRPHAHVTHAQQWDEVSDLHRSFDAMAFNTGAFDAVVSVMDLHHINDVLEYLLKISSLLKPDGLFLACFLGGKTLTELRNSLMKAELAISGKASARIHPMIDLESFAGLMQQTGFVLPVVDNDLIEATYPNLRSLLLDLQSMGETNILNQQRQGLTHPMLFQGAEQFYKQDYPDDQLSSPDAQSILATYEIIYGLGWTPGPNQPQPLKRGSGKIMLQDVL